MADLSNVPSSHFSRNTGNEAFMFREGFQPVSPRTGPIKGFLWLRSLLLPLSEQAGKLSIQVRSPLLFPWDKGNEDHRQCAVGVQHQTFKKVG